MQNLLRRPGWIFDLDGTLTRPIHDFDAIRAQLGLPVGEPILEAMARLSQAEQAPLRKRLAEIEQETATRSELALGARELLERLLELRAHVGILTRNTRENALLTLEAVGLGAFFEVDSVLGRDEAPPKPSPAGVLAHLERWACPSAEAVMVGDFAFDLQAGRAAGVTTVYVDPDGAFVHAAWADVLVRSLSELLVPEM